MQNMLLFSFLGASFSPCENLDDHSSCGSSHDKPTFFFFSFFRGLGFLLGGLRIVILLWIPCILTLITGMESVMPSCAYSGFPGILLCGFLCLMSLCILMMSGSPCEHILLLDLLIHESMHATLLHMLLCATATFS